MFVFVVFKDVDMVIRRVDLGHQSFECLGVCDMKIVGACGTIVGGHTDKLLS